MAEQLGRFTTGNVRTSPPMSVSVTKDGKEFKAYRVPAGFRLDQYVASKHPDGMMSASYPVREGATRPDYQVKVLDEHGDEVETHTGVYDEQ